MVEFWGFDGAKSRIFRIFQNFEIALLDSLAPHGVENGQPG